MDKKFKIINILNDTSVLINAGSRDGIKTNDVFNILDNEKNEIIDPDTGELLDELSQYKQKIYVKEVNKKYSLCVSKYLTDSVGESLASMVIGTAGSSSPFSELYTSQKKTIGKEMKIDSKEAKNILDEYNYTTIHVGDIVERIN